MWKKFYSKVKAFCKHNRFAHAVLPTLIYWYIQLIYYTGRIRYQHCQAIVEMMQRGENVIFCSWHSRLLLMPLFFRADPQLTKHPNLFYLASPNPDGLWMTKMAEKFNLDIVFGSTMKPKRHKANNAIAALRTILTQLQQGKNFYITPDTIIDKQTDTAFQIRGAILEIAQRTGCPIVPISFSASWQKILTTRDKFCLPFPFAKVTIACGDPIYIPKTATQLNKYKLQLETSLNNLMDDYDPR